MILAKTDYAIISIKTHYTHLTAPMDIMFGMYTQNSVRNDNIYIYIYIYIFVSFTEVNYRPLKVTRGK